MLLERFQSVVERRWNEASAAWDPDALAALYSEDAVLHGGRDSHSLGRAAIRRYFDSYSDVLAGMSIRYVDQVVRDLSPTAFIAQGYGEFRFVFRDGGRSTNILRTTLLVERVSDDWRITMQHFSPIPAEPPLHGAGGT